MKSHMHLNLFGIASKSEKHSTGKLAALPIVVILLLAGACSNPEVGPSDKVETFVTVKPSDQVDDIMLLGDRHEEERNYELAIDAYSEAIAADPEFVEAYVARAFSYLQLGQINAAMSDLNHALTVDPDYTDAHLFRGMVHSLDGNFEEAVQDFDKVLAGLDESTVGDLALVNVYFSRGSAYFFTSEYEKAIADFDRVIEIDPDYIEAYAIRGNSYDNNGDFQAAVADYARALSLNPNSSQRALVLFDLGQAYARNGNIELATANLEEALELGLHPAAADEAEAILEFLAQAEGSELPEVGLAPAWELPYFDNFSDPASGWEVGEYVGGTVGYEGGVYVVTATVIGSQMWAIPNQSFQDVEITVQTREASGPTNNNNAYGVACRVGPGLMGYFFMISGDGLFFISRIEEVGASALVPWTESDSIRKGNDINSIRAVCNGEELSLFINGELAASVQDTAFKSGDIALSAITFEDDVIEIHFDDFELKQP